MDLSELIETAKQFWSCKARPLCVRCVEHATPVVLRAVSLANLWFIICKAYVSFQWDRFISVKQSPPIWKISKVLLFRDNHDDFKDITSWFVPDDDWKEDIHANYPDWEDWKVEIRCTYGGHKYRIVARPNDTLVWPPPLDEEAKFHFHNMRGPRGILSATLIGNKEVGARDMDVTRRVQKYAGLSNDYHNTTVHVKDLFPMDDHDDNAERFIGVRIMDIRPDIGLGVNTYSYKENEIVNKKIKSE